MKNSLLKIMFLMLLLAVAAPLFAQTLPTGLTTVAKNIQDAFTSDIVKIILVCCLAGCGIAYGFNKDNEKMKRNIIAIAIAIVIVMGAQGIVDTIWGASA